MSVELKIEYLPVDALKPYEKNAKRHTDEQIQHIINSIEQFGMNDPIGIWGEKNVIVEGHGRYFALKKMGVKEVDCIRLDHLSDEDRKAYTLVHNQATLETPFDDDLLKIELDGIFDIDMSDFGFDVDMNVSPDDFGEDFSLPDGDKPEICTMTFTLHERQKELIEYAMSLVEISETFGNTNKNGNLIYEVVRQWAEQKK